MCKSEYSMTVSNLSNEVIIKIINEYKKLGWKYKTTSFSAFEGFPFRPCSIFFTWTKDTEPVFVLEYPLEEVKEIE